MDMELSEGMEILAEAAATQDEIVRNFATVGEVFDDGVSLIFDGESEPSEKHYLCNRCAVFAAGDRVRILADGGTYIVEYPVGTPQQQVQDGLPTGGTQNQVLAKNSGDNYDVVWKTLKGVPSGGTQDQVLAKNSDTNYDVGWKSANGIPSGGSQNQVLAKNSGTNYDASWKTLNGIPSGGTQNQVLTKNSSTNYDASWKAVNGVPTTGTTGYVLTKTADGATFQAAPSAMAAERVTNGYYASSNANRYATSYVIQFKTGGVSGDAAKTFYIRMGTSGTWYKLTTT